MSIPRTIIFIGPQGSGKGTQAKKLAEKINAIYIGTGSMFRKMAKEDTEFGRYIRNLIDNGELATDEDVEKVIRDRLDNSDQNQVVIFDGVPRRLSQAEWLIKYMHSAGKQDIATFYIQLPPEEAMRRMSARRVCVSCDTPHSLMENVSLEDCTKCGGQLIQREDDKPEAIKHRLDLYYHDTLPVIDFLKDKGGFHEIDGTQSIEDVASHILEVLGV